jgi:Zn-dependent protease
MMEPSPQWSTPAPPAISSPPPPRAPEPEPIAPFEEPKKHGPVRRLLGPIAAALIAFIAKFKAILLLLPKLKLLTTFGTMFVSVAAWSLFYGWTFAIGIVLLLFVHEMGHVIALRREGIKASWPMFIPFLGAVITAKSLGENALAEARVGLAGPILGSIAAAALIPVWHATGNEFWEHLAYIGFFINLFNLIPVSPLDGGRAMAAMAPWMWLVGLAVMVVFAFIFPNPFIILFIVIGGLDSWRRWKQRKAGGAEQEAYYKVTPMQRLAVGAVYIALIALLISGLQATFVNRGL